MYRIILFSTVKVLDGDFRLFTDTRCKIAFNAEGTV